jgi:phosphopentomutase
VPRRAFVIVIDACGIGALPDAAAYGDAGTNTLAHVATRCGGLELPELGRMGLGSILPLAGVPPATEPDLHGRLSAQGPGKESATGHWELMGAVTPAPLPTYPDGFPPAVLDRLRAETGRDVLGNRPMNGLEAIAEYGEQHLETGALILYTSQDSVLQLAAHEDRVPRAELHALCVRVRAAMQGEHAVGRVIARPFTGEPGSFARTPGRRDFTVPPPGPTYLDALQAAGVPVHAVGKTADFFAGRGIDEAHPGSDNATALASTTTLVDGLEHGLVFTNLVDTDQLHGHRKDTDGFHAALRRIDDTVAGWRERLGPDDLLLLTADHGCDPDHPGTDHTRESVPLLAAFAGDGGRRHDGPMADAGATAHAWLTGTDAPDLPGDSAL